MDGSGKLAGNLNRLNVPGVIFRPMYLKPFYSVGKGELLQGVQVHIMDFWQSTVERPAIPGHAGSRRPLS